MLSAHYPHKCIVLKSDAGKWLMRKECNRLGVGWSHKA